MHPRCVPCILRRIFLLFLQSHGCYDPVAPIPYQVCTVFSTAADLKRGMIVKCFRFSGTKSDGSKSGCIQSTAVPSADLHV